MLPWLFLEPNGLCYLPVRLTSSFVHKRDRNRKRPLDILMRFLIIFLPFCVSGPQQPPGGIGAAPCLPGGQEDQGAECRHQVGILITSGFHDFFSGFLMRLNNNYEYLQFIFCVVEHPPCPVLLVLCPPLACPSAKWMRRRSNRLWKKNRPGCRLLR